MYIKSLHYTNFNNTNFRKIILQVHTFANLDNMTFSDN